MKNIVTATLTALLIAATTSFAMAQNQAKHDSDNGVGYSAAQQYFTSPNSPQSGAATEF